MSTKFYI